MSHIIQELKTVQPYFEALWKERKTFEVRKNDRDFQTGQLLLLREYEPELDQYWTRWVLVRVTYVMQNPDYCKEGYVILGIKEIARAD